MSFGEALSSCSVARPAVGPPSGRPLVPGCRCCCQTSIGVLVGPRSEHAHHRAGIFDLLPEACDPHHGSEVPTAEDPDARGRCQIRSWEVDRSTAIVIARAWVLRDGQEAVWRSEHETLLPLLVNTLVVSFPDPDAWTILHDTTRPEVAVLGGSVVHRCGVKRGGFGCYTSEITRDYTSVKFAGGEERGDVASGAWRVVLDGSVVELPRKGRSNAERRRDESFARAVARAAGAQGD